MRLVEIRDLDGPNIFLLRPAIKVELALDNEEELHVAVERLSPGGDSAWIGGENPLAPLEAAARRVVDQLHEVAGRQPVPLVAQWMETPGQFSIAFGWTHRRFAKKLAEHLAEVLRGDRALGPWPPLDFEDTPGDRPLMITDAERRIPAAAITGTNGKTTTTRLLAHLLMTSGRHVGWCSTSGVYIDGEEIIAGDYSGPSGARTVLGDPRVEVAVLETARGGILLRGLACESNDVSVFTNISADHLNLHGIRSVEGLARTKAVVVLTTRKEGLAVLNADDPLVMGATRDANAERLLFSLVENNPAVASHRGRGGKALIALKGDIFLCEGASQTLLLGGDELPISFGGRARHMIQNAMAAAGAAIGLGLSLEEISRGLQTFKSSPEFNPGRLNVFDVSGVTAILDFAHNEAGLNVLLDFAELLRAPGGKIAVVIGTAGDRPDESLRELGRIAASRADRVIAKQTEKYGRGRTNEEMIALHREGVRQAGRDDLEVAESEEAGLQIALEGSQPGDVVALMCQEHVPQVVARLTEIGTPVG